MILRRPNINVMNRSESGYDEAHSAVQKDHRNDIQLLQRPCNCSRGQGKHYLGSFVLARRGNRLSLASHEQIRFNDSKPKACFARLTLHPQIFDLC